MRRAAPASTFAVLRRAGHDQQRRRKPGRKTGEAGASVPSGQTASPLGRSHPPYDPSKSRSVASSRLAASLLTALAAIATPRAASAQADVNPPLPNVLLLVDTSGSMEYESSSNRFPTCDPDGTQASEKSRWIELVEVLSGSIQDYRCAALDRSSAAFRDEYQISSVDPYDWGYKNPYHRPLSGTCTPGPGNLPSNPYAWSEIAFHHHADRSRPCSTFQQANDGLLDAFLLRVRFGLMTFDPLPHPGTGVSGASANLNSGMKGTWSYFLSSSRQGKPAACTTLSDFEVGARNAAAPPWEGRMVAFGPPAASGAQVEEKNQQIQKILLASRPFGATPIAAMLDDAKNFLWNDTSADPLDSTRSFGPRDDPFIQGGCRRNFVLLLTDGEPNTDLRPFCEALGPPAGVCPYDKPEEIAAALATAADPARRVRTFVVGFALSQVEVEGSAGSVDCEKLTTTDLSSPSGVCARNPDEKALQACCTLNRIAFNGDTERAYFANDKEQLRVALSAVLSTISAATTSRTLPVFATAPSANDPFAAGYRFYSSFEPQQFSLWSGVIERQRFSCSKDPVTGALEPVPLAIDPNKGDDFVANVNSGSGPARQFISVRADATAQGTQRHSQRSIRPELTSDPDGLGQYGGVQYREPAENFVTSTPASAMAINATTCPGLTADQCRDRFLRWTLGLDNGTTFHRCPVPGSAECRLVGDVFHSTPRIVGRPSEFLRDESYQLFAAQQVSRPLVLYTSTNDGFLHAFKVAAGSTTDSQKIDKKENNELWAFVPPAVLPALPSQYPGTHQILLDGVPVIRDVVATQPNPDVPSFRLERAAATAQQGQGTWRSILVQSFGGARGGYFALDVTDPVPTQSQGPRFLWQLTEDQSGNPLFGSTGVTPLITTLFVDVGGGDAREIAVAVLPGGEGGSPSATVCDRQSPLDAVDPDFPARPQVSCAAPSAARSLTIVRLDTGEVIRSFRRDGDPMPPGLAAANRVTLVPIDSPITGTPVAFPGTTGAVADRIFVGDRDGTLWRLDVSSADPANWTMKILFDAFSGQPATAGQPIEAPPVLSVDGLGAVTLAFSTGDQDVLTAAAGMKNFVFSITEKLDATGQKQISKVNWFTQLVDGERVAGPMTLFNGALFFSTYKPEPPASTNVCSSGSSRVWGVDYVVPKDASDLSRGGKERLPDDAPASLVQFIDSTSSLLQDGAIIFGVGVAQLPSCTEEVNVDDPFFGSGSHTAITNVAPGKFQLVMHTGNVGQTVSGGKSNVLTIDLPAPPSTARIDSWAAILE
jgi:type IV pilus assembly protein PilY1